MNNRKLHFVIPAIVAGWTVASVAAVMFWPDPQFKLRQPENRTRLGVNYVGPLTEAMNQAAATWREALQAANPDAGGGPVQEADGPPGMLTTGPGTPAPELDGRWPRFLNANFTNVSTDTTPLADAWPEAGPSILWQTELGTGHAGPVVLNGRIYVLDHDEQRGGDVLRCLSLADGREIWNRWYPIPLKDDHGISRSNPSVTNTHVVTLGPRCHAMCVDAKTGAYKWGMDLVDRYGTRVPEWYSSQSPLIDGDKAIFATGGKALLIAVALEPADAKGTPKILWETPNPMPDKTVEGRVERGLHITHSSVVPMEVAERRTYVYCSTKGIVGVDAKTGKLLWHWNLWRPGINAASPIVLDENRVLVTAETGALILRISPDGDGLKAEKAEEVLARDFSSYQQTPVKYDGRLYVILSQKAGRYRQQLACFDLQLKRLWESGRQERYKWGPYIVADGKLILLNGDGTLSLAEASSSGYKLLGRCRPEPLTHGDAWAPMVVVNGRLLVRDKNTLVCMDLRKQ